MAKQGASTVMPRLRFPEFREEGSWEEHTLKQLATEFLDGDWIESKDQSESGFRLIQTGNIGVGVFIEKSGKTRYISAETFVRLRCTEVFPGDCLVSRLPDPAGRSCLLPDIGARMITAVDCTIVRFDEKKIIPSLFIAHSQTENYFREVAALSSGSTRQRISRENLSSLPVFLPNIDEQQKIADCLTSLDEVIAAQGRIVAALKAHKRGLMQQLFPREGETRPRLRFPEFRNAPEWAQKALSCICEMQAGKFVSASAIAEKQGEGMYPCYGGNGIRGYTRTFTHSGIYSLIGRQGALCGNVQLARGDFHATEHALVASPRPGVDVDWLFYTLDLLNLNRFATGQAQPGLSVDVLNKVECAVPASEKEQRRIADCLSSLDTQITAESNQLAALKTHKQGLMQQLFPSREVVAA
ncbi:restriction endonuclease subunit S [Pseudoxanthomonas spadix]|nr:restriction endonuclease subunit S [Pseudoxanthomonas spadix]